MAQFLPVKWLLSFLIFSQKFEFDWDDGNSTKNLEKHGVDKLTIEGTFNDLDLIALGVQIQPRLEEPRYGVVGKSLNEKILFVCFTIRGKKIRPISSRLANVKERMIYDKEIRKISP